MSHQPDNIFAGTQVVSLIEVRGTNHSLVHRGEAYVIVFFLEAKSPKAKTRGVDTRPKGK